MSMLEDIKAAEKAADELKKEKTAAARTHFARCPGRSPEGSGRPRGKGPGGSAEDRFGSRSKGP